MLYFNSFAESIQYVICYLPSLILVCLISVMFSMLFARELFSSSRPEVFLEKGVLKTCSNLQENTHAEVRHFGKSHFGMGVLS